MKKYTVLTMALILCVVLLSGTVLAADFEIENGVARAYNGTSTDVVIPDGVTSIRINFDSIQLTSIVIPEGVTSIPSNAFRNQASLARVTLPESLTSIGMRAFSGTAITSIQFGKELKSIGSGAFSNCKSLAKVEFPSDSKLELIEAAAFSNCTSLKKMTFPDKMTYIGSNPLSGCTSLETVYLGNPSLFYDLNRSLRELPNKIEYEYPESAWFAVDTANTGAEYLTGYRGPKNVDVVIPDRFTTIGTNSFNGTEITGVTFGSKVTKIDTYAFQNCKKLTEVTIPATITEVGRGAFNGCDNLKRLIVENPDTTKLDRYAAPDSVEIVYPESHWFEISENGRLEKYKGPQNQNVVIPETVKIIGVTCFFNMDITGVTLSSNLESIYTGAFQNCKKLTTLTVPKSVTRIGGRAFYGCDNLKTVLLEGYDTVCEREAFPSDTIIQHAEHNYSATTGDFVIENGVLKKYTGDAADVVVPEGVTKIESNVFASAFLKKLTLPSSLTTLSNSTIGSCRNLTDITIPAGFTTVDPSYGAPYPSFFTSDQIREQVKIHCAQGSYAEEWARETDTPYVTDLPAVGKSSFIVQLDYSTSVYGSEVPVQSLKLRNGDTYKDLPTVTATRRYNIDGWYLNGTQITADTVVNLERNVTLRAKVSLRERTAEEVWESELSTLLDNPMYQRRIATNNAFLGKIQEKDYAYTIVTDDIRKQADEICTGLSTDKEKVTAIHKWVTENIFYDLPNKGITPILSAQTVMEKRCGVCSSYSTLFQGLCMAKGIPCVYLHGDTSEGYHAWNVVRLDGKWEWVDSTWDTFNKVDLNWKWYRGKTRQHYFLCPTEYISINHTADKAVTINGINANIASQTAEETQRLIAEQEELQKREGLSAEGIMDWIEESGKLSDWAATEVDQAARNNLILDELAPDVSVPITRDEFCRLAVNLLERCSEKTVEEFAAAQGKTITDPFNDTDRQEVLAACALGIVNGKGNGKFDPNGSISRQEAAAMLMRTAKLLGATQGTPVSFNDTAALQTWAREGIDFISSLVDPTNGKSVMGGIGSGRFGPTGTFTRQQSILTMLRLFNTLKK